jgi:hypothetical protein
VLPLCYCCWPSINKFIEQSGHLLDCQGAPLLKQGPCQLGPVQDVAVALAVAVVDGQLFHRLELAAILNVLAWLNKVFNKFSMESFKLVIDEGES